MSFNYFLENLVHSFSYLDKINQEFPTIEVSLYMANYRSYELEFYEFFKSHKETLGYVSIMPETNGVYSVDRFGDIAYHIRAYGNIEEIEVSTRNGSLTNKEDIEEFRNIVQEYSKFLDGLLKILRDNNLDFNLDLNNPI